MALEQVMKLVPNEVAFTHFTCSFPTEYIAVTFLRNWELICRFSDE